MNGGDFLLKKQQFKKVNFCTENLVSIVPPF